MVRISLFDKQLWSMSIKHSFSFSISILIFLCYLLHPFGLYIHITFNVFFFASIKGVKLFSTDFFRLFEGFTVTPLFNIREWCRKTSLTPPLSAYACPKFGTCKSEVVVYSCQIYFSQNNIYKLGC